MQSLWQTGGKSLLYNFQDKAIKRFSVKDIVDGSSKRDIGESKAFEGNLII